MFTRRIVARALALAAVVLPGLGQARGQGQPASEAGAVASESPPETTVRFSFEIFNLVTNHRFDGQKNRFLVT